MSENTVIIDNEEVSFADLAGIDLSSVEAVRFSVTPAGKFQWRVKEIGLENKEVVENYEEPDSGTIQIAAMVVILKAVNCFALVDDNLDPADYIEIEHHLNFNIREAKKGMGKIVAFFEDIGIDTKAPGRTMQDLMDEAHGLEFVSDIVNSKLRNNPDIVLANLRNTMTVEKHLETTG